MFILNNNTKVIQECHNADVIKVCRKDTKNYTVAATREELAAVAKLAQNQPEAKKVEENTIEEPKAAPEGKSEGQDANSEAEQSSEQQGTNDDAQDDWKKLNEEEKLAALESKKVEELRKIAKAEGIQGYGNMNKDTLVAMIMNH